MKNYKLVILDSAEDDLLAIIDYIASDNITRAIEWTQSLRDRAKTLCQFPEKGRPHNDTYRVLVADRGYRVFYRVDHKRETVVIVHFYTPKDPRFEARKS